jgi:hypothetical protein
MTASTDEGTLDPKRQAALKSLMADLPERYADRYAAIQNIRHAFHREMALVLQPVLNEHIPGRPQDSAKERQELAAWINEQLRNIGLAVKCGKTGRPASIVVDSQDRAHSDITRFRFSTRSENGKYSHTSTAQNLGELELTEHNPRIEPLAKFVRRKRLDGPRR